MPRRSAVYYRPNNGYAKGYTGRAYGLDKPSMQLGMPRTRYAANRYARYGARSGYGGRRFGYNRVRDIALKLEGLQVYQRVLLGNARSEFGERTYVPLFIGSSPQLRDWKILDPDSSGKLYARSMQCDCTFQNGDNFGVRMTTYQL